MDINETIFFLLLDVEYNNIYGKSELDQKHI
jgi:hypothetical protein